MDGACAERLDSVAGRKEYLFDRAIIRKHGDKRLRAGSGFTWSLRNCYAQRPQHLGPALRAVVNRQRMSRFYQIARHTRSHVAETDKPDLHLAPPLFIADALCPF